MNLEERVVIVTGGARGLGRAYALEMARHGARVVVNDLRAADAEPVANEIRAHGGASLVVAGSVADVRAAQSIVDAAVDAYGRLDGIVCNAGNLRDKPFGEMLEEDFRILMDVHYFGTVWMVRAAWPLMTRQAYGRIVLTTSVSGLYGTLHETNYSPAKLAVVGFMRALLREAPEGVRVNAVAPVATTDMTRGFWNDEATEAFAPERVAPLVVALISERAPQGRIIAAGGGAFVGVGLAETPGLHLPDERLSPDTILDALPSILDSPAPVDFHRSGQHVDKLLALGGRGSHERKG